MKSLARLIVSVFILFISFPGVTAQVLQRSAYQNLTWPQDSIEVRTRRLEVQKVQIEKVRALLDAAVKADTKDSERAKDAILEAAAEIATTKADEEALVTTRNIKLSFLTTEFPVILTNYTKDSSGKYVILPTIAAGAALTYVFADGIMSTDEISSLANFFSIGAGINAGYNSDNQNLQIIPNVIVAIGPLLALSIGIDITNENDNTWVFGIGTKVDLTSISNNKAWFLHEYK
jgi:hypothetical protein